MLRRVLGRVAALGTGSSAGWFGADPADKLDEPGDLRVVPYVQELRRQGWSELDSTAPDMHRRHMFSVSVLNGPGKIEAGPLILQNDRDLVAVYRLGSQVGDHVHDGVCATIFDESLAACAFQQLPHKLGVTASLEIESVQGLPLNGGIVALRAGIEQSADGPYQPQPHSRKSYASGTLWHIDAASKNHLLLARGRVLMIEPRWAGYISWLA